MKIFISWSGPRARAIAEYLRTWLGDVHHKVDPWVSSEDIDPGSRWNAELSKELEGTKYGIVCLTPESSSAPWVLFEAGALAKTLGSARVCPYLFGMEPRDLQQPLAQFDAVSASRQGTLKLLRGINHSLNGESPLPDDRLVKSFERWWPDLEEMLRNVPPPQSIPDLNPLGSAALGLEGVFRSRSDALTFFGTALKREIDRSRRGQRGIIYITSTSMRGFLATDAKDFHGPRLIEEIVESKCDLHILLTHPDTAERRAEQEKRPPGAISGEVRGTVIHLKTLGITPDRIKYYKGAPTVYGIATSDAMLLNPYPYENESHRCMTLVVHKTEDGGDVYHQYFDAHFDRPWSHALPVEEVGESLSI